MKKAVILLSGGIDSSTTISIAKHEGYELYALSFDYGQRHAIELQAAARVAASVGAVKHLVTRFDMRNIGGSALTDNIDVPKDNPQEQKRGSAEAPDQIPVTYVPARNTIFLSFALAWAEVLGASDIFIGANAVDYSGYPDCRPEYLEAFETMANLATKASVEGGLKFRIHAPLLKMTKSEIINTGLKLGFDYSLTWSCYDPQEMETEAQKHGSAEAKEKKSFSPDAFRSPKLQDSRAYAACGRCDSCIFRKKGFEEAGTSDPIRYIL